MTAAGRDAGANAGAVTTGFNFCLFVVAALSPTICVLPHIHTRAKIQCPLNIYFREATLFHIYM